MCVCNYLLYIINGNISEASLSLSIHWNISPLSESAALEYVYVTCPGPATNEEVLLK